MKLIPQIVGEKLMKFAFILGFLIVLLPSLLPNQEKVKGGFRECRVYDFHYKKGVLDTSSKKLMDIDNFDQNGNLTERYDYHFFDGKLKRKYIYDSNDRMIEDARIYNDSIFSFKTNFIYDNSGKLIEEIKQERSHCIDFFATKEENVEISRKIYINKTKYIYNDKGKLIEEIIFYESLSDKHRFFEYDKDGKLIRNWFSDTGSGSIYNYNEKNELIARIYYSQAGVVSEKYTYSYDDSGRLTEELISFPDGSEYIKIENKYDVDGNKIEEIKWLYSKFDDRTTFKHDIYGNIIEEVHYTYELNKPDTKTEYIYTK